MTNPRALLLLVLAAIPSAAQRSHNPDSARVITADIPRFLGTDLSGWFESSDVSARPADVGYFVGYRIAQAYYQNATDKRRAIRDILRMRDPEDFLKRSRYDGSLSRIRGST